MVSRRDDFLGGRRTMKPSRRSCENASSDCEEEIFCMGSSCSSLCPSILVLIAVLLLVLCHSANLQICALVARLSARYLKQTRSLFSPRGGGERGCRRGITAQSLSSSQSRIIPSVESPQRWSSSVQKIHFDVFFRNQEPRASTARGDPRSNYPFRTAGDATTIHPRR